LPIGIAVVKWDDRIGTKLIAKYPPDIEVNPVLTMRVYGSHVLGERRESNFITMKVDDLNIASYFGGITINKFVMMILEPTERGEDYQEAITLLGGEILPLDDEGIIKRLPEVYAKITSFLQYSVPQRIALALLDDDRYEVVQHLLEVGHTRVSEVRKFTKEKPVDFILDPLIDFQIVSRKWVQGINDEIVYLLRYIWVGRTPPSTFPTEITSTVQAFFDEYALTDSEIKLVLNTLVDQVSYNIVSYLDKSQPRTVDELIAALNFTEDEVLDAVDKLEGNNFLVRKGEYYYLISRPTIVTPIAKHLIRQVLRELNEGVIERSVALHILTDIRNELAKELGVL